MSFVFVSREAVSYKKYSSLLSVLMITAAERNAWAEKKKIRRVILNQDDVIDCEEQKLVKKQKWLQWNKIRMRLKF